MDTFSEYKVAIVKASATEYPKQAPFNPPEIFPEYALPDNSVDTQNHVYAVVREALHLLGMDAANYGKPSWNPLGAIITPGDKVLIKPNFALDAHLKNMDVNSIITHGSILRAIIDYALIALAGTGEIIIADAPLMRADFKEILSKTGTSKVAEFYQKQGYNIGIIDLRAEQAEIRDKYFIDRRKKLQGDPKGYCRINLSSDSELYEISHLSKKFRGSDYNTEETYLRHHGETQEYLISRSVLESDVVISVPKLKTHMKAGVTLNLKNMIGINGDKNWIPHFRAGSPKSGGDEFPTENWFKKIESIVKDVVESVAYRTTNKYLLAAIGKLSMIEKSIVEAYGNSSISCSSGSWYGNDTLWRCIVDINKILLYANKQGQMQEKQQRKYLSLIDGIVGGEGEGPLSPIPKRAGVILAGANPIAVDICATMLMGFDYEKIPLISNALKLRKYRLIDFNVGSIVCKSNVSEWSNLLTLKRSRSYDTGRSGSLHLGFKAPPRWLGYIENQD